MNSSFSFNLEQNFPNPFNPNTTITYSISVKSDVVIELFNALGQRVSILLNGEIEAGSYQVNLNAVNLPGGIYFYRLRAGGYIAVRKMVLMK